MTGPRVRSKVGDRLILIGIIKITKALKKIAPTFAILTK
jgi:hypothetical protein